MTSLKYTVDEVRDRQLVGLGTEGRPNGWWPGGMATNDCVGRQSYVLGLRTGTESLATLTAHPEWISISAFRMHYRWPETEYLDHGQLAAGMLLAENWDGIADGGRLVPGHMEYLYSVDHATGTIVTVAANTGPEPGVPSPNGLHKKTRTLDGHILFGIEVPYLGAKPSKAYVAEVKAVAAFVNDPKNVPGSLPRTSSDKDGISDNAPNYWRRVQTYGRRREWYPPEYVIDGVPGPKTRSVEAAIYHQIATLKK